VDRYLIPKIKREIVDKLNCLCDGNDFVHMVEDSYLLQDKNIPLTILLYVEKAEMEYKQYDIDGRSYI
jgi:hypothetical protein